MRAMRTSTCGRGFGWHHVGSRSAADDSDVDRQALFQIGEAGDFFDLTRQLKNRVHALLEIEAGMRGLAGNFDEIFANSFARSFHGAVPSIGRLEHEHSGSFFCQRLGDRSRRVAAYFLVGDEEHGDGARATCHGLSLPCHAAERRARAASVRCPTSYRGRRVQSARCPRRGRAWRRACPADRRYRSGLAAAPAWPDLPPKSNRPAGDCRSLSRWWNANFRRRAGKTYARWPPPRGPRRLCCRWETRFRPAHGWSKRSGRGAR